jgi:hypothetical protein
MHKGNSKIDDKAAKEKKDKAAKEKRGKAARDKSNETQKDNKVKLQDDADEDDDIEDTKTKQQVVAEAAVNQVSTVTCCKHDCFSIEFPGKTGISTLEAETA